MSCLAWYSWIFMRRTPPHVGSFPRERTLDSTQAVISDRVYRGEDGRETVLLQRFGHRRRDDSPAEHHDVAASRSASSSTTRGNSAMCAPDSDDSPMASTSSCMAVSTICSGVWCSPE
jgi:hypothetical protein